MAAQQGNWVSKADWQASRMRGELSRNVWSPTGPVARFLAGKPPVKSPPKNTFADLTETLNRQIQAAINDAIREHTPQPSLDDIKAAAKAGKRLYFDGESTCFASISFQDGIVDVKFQSGHAYAAPLDLETFLEWMADDSAGGFYNSRLGRDYFAPKK